MSQQQQPRTFHVLTATTSGKVSTVEELDAILAESLTAGSGRPQWIHVSATPDYSADAIAFGIGRDWSFLYHDNSHVPGDLAPDDEYDRTWWDGSQGGVSRRGRGIPADVALDAAREFVRTGQRPSLPDGYEWRDD